MITTLRLIRLGSARALTRAEEDGPYEEVGLFRTKIPPM